jgi:uncharacterized repeat protein (TIGR03899 family)
MPETMEAKIGMNFPVLIKDLLGMKHVTEPLCKLIETVASAMGILHEPRRIRKRAKAEAEAAIIQAKADIEIRRLNARADRRLVNQEIRRQKNIEAVLKGAAQQLPEHVSDKAVDEDWIFEFFNCCQDIGQSEMQVLWSKILAGEITKPGTYSLRTLNLLKTVTKDDANLFTTLCCYAWRDNDLYINIYTQETDSVMMKNGLLYFNLLHLMSIGLIQMEKDLGYYFDKGLPLTFSYFKTQFSFSSINLAATLHTRMFTQIGSELAAIAGAEPNQEYLDCLKNSLEQENICMKMVGISPL